MFCTSRIAALLAASTLIAGCASAPETPRSEAELVAVNDFWVKAAADGMTAAFGRLSNTGDRDVRIVSASTPTAATVELHEVVSDGGAMTMRPKTGGFVIPGGAEAELRPGGDHFMLMDLTQAVTPGTDVQLVATFEDGSTLPVTAQVRDFPGADEHYSPGTHG
jgi:periplasmic copper chaperone A